MINLSGPLWNKSSTSCFPRKKFNTEGSKATVRQRVKPGLEEATLWRTVASLLFCNMQGEHRAMLLASIYRLFRQKFDFRTACVGLFMLLALCTAACNLRGGDWYVAHKKSSTNSEPLAIRSTESPAVGDSREPELNATSDGRIILSWVEKVDENRYSLRMSIRDQAGWSTPQTVSERDNWFVNWADFPSVIALADGSLAAHWLVKNGNQTYAYNVNIAISRDGGKTWSKPIVPHLDNTPTEHGFVSLLPLSDGKVGAIWLDGRNMIDMKNDHGKDKTLPVSMTLRYAAIDMNGKLSDEVQLDDRVCECCHTSATLTSDGVIAVYRDRSQNEVRDISFVRRTSGSWTQPQQVGADHWLINGCPVNGPSVSADGSKVAIAWYTAAGGTAHVKIAFSTDAGATFGSAIQVDDGETQGRVDVLLLSDTSALVCWLSGTPEGGAIKVRRVHQDGSQGPSAVIAETDISRSSGFPRMARLGDQVYFAWTEFGEPSKVRTAVTDVSAYK